MCECKTIIDIAPGVSQIGSQLKERLCLPELDQKALAGLKFSDARFWPLAVRTLAARKADVGPSFVLNELVSLAIRRRVVSMPTHLRGYLLEEGNLPAS